MGYFLVAGQFEILVKTHHHERISRTGAKMLSNSLSGVLSWRPCACAGDGFFLVMFETDPLLTFYWCLQNGLVVSPLTTSAVVPFGLLIMYNLPEDRQKQWNIALLVVSCLALIFQWLLNAMRLKERSLHGRKVTARLDAKRIKFLGGDISSKEFREASILFLKEVNDEESP